MTYPAKGNDQTNFQRFSKLINLFLVFNIDSKSLIALKSKITLFLSTGNFVMYKPWNIRVNTCKLFQSYVILRSQLIIFRKSFLWISSQTGQKDNRETTAWRLIFPYIFIFKGLISELSMAHNNLLFLNQRWSICLN